MKKIIYFAIIALTLAACAKNDPSIKGEHFDAGQEVTLFVSAPNSDSKVTSHVGDDGTSITFKWQANDKILVSIGDKKTYFELIEGAGTANGKFIGYMPDEGNAFSVQYPADGEPNIRSQWYYSAYALPTTADTGNQAMMFFTAENCTVSGGKGTFKLNPKYAALRIPISGNGMNITNIKVYDYKDGVKTETPYVLKFNVRKLLTSTTDFRVVIAPGKYNFDIDIIGTELTYKEGTGYKTLISINNLNTRGKEIVAGKVYKLPDQEVFFLYQDTGKKCVKIGDYWWAPVNCGYDDSHPYGLMYQYGRYAGSNYNESSGTTQTPVDASTYWTDNGCNTSPEANKFYQNSTSPHSWYTGTSSSWFTGWPLDDSDAKRVAEKIDNPCPNGWEVPTKEQFKTLIGGNSSISTSGYTTTDDGMNGYYLNGGTTVTSSSDNVIFFPAAGQLTVRGSGSDRGITGFYWTKEVSNAAGCSFDLTSSTIKNNQTHGQANGFSVRCVKINPVRNDSSTN